MLIIVNEQANAGNGARRWRRVEAALRDRGTIFDVAATRSLADVDRVVAGAARQGHDVVVAAGGDGTVNGVLNAVLNNDVDVALGAIGLGSSNDFHKPFAPDHRLDGVPVRLDPARAIRADVGRAALTDSSGVTRTRYFVLNASLGVVAQGNAFFNAPDKTLRALKKTSVDLAIAYAAMVSIKRFKPIELRVSLDDQPPQPMPLTAMGILKTIHFAGGMRYDTPVAADDGMFAVNVWEPMHRSSIVGQILALYRGKFTGRPHTQVHRTRRVRLTADTPFDFELDGEVSKVSQADIEVVPGAVRLCG
ncbi:MAG: diacylglycerol kinase family protein [Acidobacteriota bacterium]